jgi:hypothetical protein
LEIAKKERVDPFVIDLLLSLFLILARKWASARAHVSSGSPLPFIMRSLRLFALEDANFRGPAPATARAASTVWMTPPSAIIPTRPNKLRHAKQAKGAATASNKSTLIADVLAPAAAQPGLF